MKNSAKVTVTFQGVNGKNFSPLKSVGVAVLRVESQESQEDKYPLYAHAPTILIDAFSGSGDSYKRREKSLIEIKNKGYVLFSGDFERLEKTFKAPIMVVEILDGVLNDPVLCNNFTDAKKHFEILLERHNLTDKVENVESVILNGGFDNENGVEIAVRWPKWVRDGEILI